MIPLWNTWYFFSLYANAEGYEANVGGPESLGSEDPLDRYLLAKTRQYVEKLTGELDEFAIADACETTRGFLDVLTNWYVRRSRERFWEGRPEAFETLAAVLDTVCRTVAPLLPLTAEEVWRGLTGGRSVHLTDWPDPSVLPADDALVAAMDQVREICSATSALRKAGSLRNRLPLGSLTVVVDDPASLAAFTSIVADEVNVKQVRLLAADSPEATAYGVSQRLTVNARVAGPRLGKDVQTAIKASKSGEWEAVVSPEGAVSVTAGGLELAEGEYTLETVVGSEGSDSATGMLVGGGFVVLDTVVTPELAEEGLARDLVRAVQQARRDAGLDVTDRIVLTIGGSAAVLAAAQAHDDLIAKETLATSYSVAGEAAGGLVTVGDGETATVTVSRA
jgi:isoleucyl-tRNA synthetase